MKEKKTILRGFQSGNAKGTGNVSSSPMKISGFINDVKNDLDDTFPKAVYQQVGTTRKDNDISRGMKYSTRQQNVDTSNYKNYFMRDGQMIQQDGNRNETVLTGVDREYVEAWKKGDYARMEEILADKIRENGAIPFKTPASYNDPDHSWVANAIKKGDTYAICRAAMEMAQLVPKNAVLIPMPNRHGEVSEDTDTMILANEIAKATGSPVVSALAGVERSSRQEDKLKPKSQ